MLDGSTNTRDIKRYAVDHVGYVPPEPCTKSIGKWIAIVGGGPGGSSAAYYLQRMGHQTAVYGERKSLGGMLRCRIPNYRLSRARPDEEIEVVKAAGVETHAGMDIGKDIVMCDLDKEFNVVYLAIGTQTDKRVGVPGENGENAISAITMLRKIGDDITSDFKGKHVLIIGDGNVVMSVVRGSKRLSAAYAGIVYRGRQENMTTLPQEVEDALAEGCELLPLQVPMRIELDEEQKVTALWVRPQMISSYRKGRPSLKQAGTEEKRIPCDIVVTAIGQNIESQHFVEEGVPTRHGTIDALDHSGVKNMEDIFARGDCVTGPATAIRAIAAGKVATTNIDEYFGYHHVIEHDVIIPTANYTDRPEYGRIQLKEWQTTIRNASFEPIEYSMSSEKAQQECGRCLCCDRYGFGVFKGGGTTKW